MTGEMRQSEVTRDTYPGLFRLRDALKRRGISSEPRAFDQYQGPYLSVPGVGKVWYHSTSPLFFLIDDGIAPAYGGTFQTAKATHVMPETGTSIAAGLYTLRQAARRIAEVAK
jgi:hypothetical protein